MPYSDYESYISSTRWERRKTAYYSRYPRRCRACDSSENIHLHHHTYKRMGHEIDSDLVPLCEPCHVLVHKHHRSRDWDLTRATSDFLRLYGASLRVSTGTRPDKKDKTRTPLAPGMRVVVVGQSLALSWARGKEATVITAGDISRVEVDGHPGSRLAVTNKTIRRIR